MTVAARLSRVVCVVVCVRVSLTFHRRRGAAAALNLSAAVNLLLLQRTTNIDLCGEVGARA